MYFEYTDELGQLNKYNVLKIFTYKNDNYIVYTSDNSDIQASKYLTSNDKIILQPILDDVVWNIVNEYIQKGDQI